MTGRARDSTGPDERADPQPPAATPPARTVPPIEAAGSASAAQPVPGSAPDPARIQTPARDAPSPAKALRTVGQPEYGLEVGVASEAALRVNRTRQVVSLVSQLIIRSYDEEALHAEACRFLVSFGGYLVAWVGLVEETPRRAVRPVAQAGLGPEFLQALKNAWSHEQAHRSPTGRAVTDQRPYVARRIPTEPHLAGLRENAQRFGYAATCALPMQFGSHGMGVLTVHAAEPDAFGFEEVSLLRELANDLAAGVIGLREKVKRELLEEHTRRAEARYRGMIENARDGIFHATIDGRLTMVNDAFIALLGFPDQSALLATGGQTVPDLLHPKDSWPAMASAAARDKPGPTQCRFRRADGTWVWVDLRLHVVETPEHSFLEGFVRDMTGARAQQEASARLAAVVDAADDAIVGIKLDGTVSDWNQGATRLFGFARDEVLGRRLADFLVPDDRQQEDADIRARIGRGERVPRFETVRRRKDGRLVHTSVMVSPILAPDGELLGSAVVEHDITDVRRAKAARRVRELEDAEVTKLKSLEKIRKTFMSEASHELNTPLTPLRIHVETLAEADDLTEKHREHVAVIERNVIRLCNLVKGMLEASRLETGRFNLEVANVPVSSLLADVFQTVADTARRAQVTLTVEPMGRVTVYADRNRIAQVLYNLINNAIHYSPPKSIVTVRVRAEGGHAIVRVIDQGVGLSSDQIAQLFQPFSRPHEGIATAPKGTGLGLFISKGIIEQHGGRIWAESEGPGKGSSFCFTLPLAVPALSSEATREAPTVRRLSRPPPATP